MSRARGLPRLARYAVLALTLAAMPVPAQDGVIEATTAAGERVRLMPNGRWEYAEPAKAQVQREQRRGEDAREAGAQGGLLGFGRRIHDGDKDYNRGSLNPKLR